MRIYVPIAAIILCLFASPTFAADYNDNLLIATVNGEPLSLEEINTAVREIHMYKPQTRATGESSMLDLEEIIDKLVEERLIIQEARRLGLREMETFKRNISEFIGVQSVLRMRSEEVDEKAKISDQEAHDYFKRQYGEEDERLEEEFQKHKSSIKRKLSKDREEELSENFVNALKEKVDIEIDEDLVEELDPLAGAPEDGLVVARVGENSITAEEFLGELTKYAKNKSFHAKPGEVITPELRKNVIDNLVRFSLLRQEALRRDYLKEPNFAELVERRKEVLLLDEFKRRVIVPAATPTNEEVFEYYKENPKEFRSIIEVRLSKIELKDKAEAEQVLAELRAGADFRFMLSSVKGRRMQQRITPWTPLFQLPGNIGAQLEDLEAGGISDVLSWGRDYVIVKINDRRGGEVLPFEEVARKAAELAGRDKYMTVFRNYVRELRDEAKIEIYQHAVEQVRDMLFQDKREDNVKSGV